jgi:hypothetical protein
VNRRWLAVATSLVVTACAHSSSGAAVPLPDGEHITGRELTSAVRSLCDATDLAHRDPTGAGSLFYLRSHTDLHSLASALRIAAADNQSAGVLEAMYSVEQDIAAKPPRPTLAAHLSALTAQAAAGLGALHVPAPACTSGTHL